MKKNQKKSSNKKNIPVENQNKSINMTRRKIEDILDKREFDKLFNM
ncbi:adenosine deaminase [Photobacterium lutimaris]|uniref:Adenosine deaminase n=1 Tax=Photobacterium lutimaris TaxID=388278 RepID=A0A2T3IL28_9GAMM|nr:adenosine deaminase [Photobacterium lutimaris]